MQRGISYRSTRRVPSHMILQFGKGMSLCRLVQAAGRANGKQAQQLMDNMDLSVPDTGSRREAAHDLARL